MNNKDKNILRENIAKLVDEYGPIRIKFLVEKAEAQGYSADEVKAASRHLIQQGILDLDDNMFLIISDAVRDISIPLSLIVNENEKQAYAKKRLQNYSKMIKKETEKALKEANIELGPPKINQNYKKICFILLNQLEMEENKVELLEENLECVHLYLDRYKIERQDKHGKAYSIVGRIQMLMEEIAYWCDCYGSDLNAALWEDDTLRKYAEGAWECGRIIREGIAVSRHE